MRLNWLFRQLDDPLPGVARGLARDDLLYWEQDFQRPGRTGKSWLRPDKIFHACGDVSDTGYAGYSALLCAPIVIGYSQHDMLKMTPGKGTSQVPDR